MRKCTQQLLTLLPENFRSLLDSVGSGVQMDATTLNNVGTCSGLHHNIDKLKEFE